MPRASSVALLPDDIKSRLQELLQDPRVSQMDVARRINELLEAQGEELRISKSAINRYKLRMDEVGEKLRQSREVAEMWVGKLGAAPQGKIGNLVNEILRTLAFDVTLAIERGGIDEENAPAIAGVLKDMALATQRLEQAATLNVKREEEIRRQERAKAAEAATQVARDAGLSEDAIKDIRQMLGIPA